MRDTRDTSSGSRRSSPPAGGSGGGQGPDRAPQLEVAALGYDPERASAPRLLAHGVGHAAERILDLAREHDVPLRHDPTLVSILGALDVGTEIPPDLYGVIAEVLAWAYNVDKAAAARADRRAA